MDDDRPWLESTCFEKFSLDSNGMFIMSKYDLIDKD